MEILIYKIIIISQFLGFLLWMDIEGSEQIVVSTFLYIVITGIIFGLIFFLLLLLGLV